MTEPAPDTSAGASEHFPPGKLATLFASVFVIATNGVIYELLIAGYSSYLLGDSITQFSLTIGVFLSAMGLGSYLTRFLHRGLLDAFIWVELGIAAVGGPAVLALFAAYQLEVAYAAAMLGLAGLVGMLIGFEIPIVARIAAERSALRKAIADVLSLDYLGALLGSLLFPLVLLPALGFTRTSFAIGLANLVVAGANLVAFRDQVRHRGVLVASTIVLGALLVAGLVATPELRAALESLRR
jgi:spermidine synthase